MLKYPCLVLDHDETVVQSEKTIGYPCFCKTLSRLRPLETITLEEYVHWCNEIGFVEMCRTRFQFTDEELTEEYNDWMEYVKTHVPEPFADIHRVIHRQKELGGMVCVVSHSSQKNISRDYRIHFDLLPDAIYGCDYPKEQQKPMPYPLLDIMRRYQLKPEEILVVDDMQLACQMAELLNIAVAFAAWGKQEFPAISRQMRSICQYTFETPMELYRFLFEE